MRRLFIVNPAARSCPPDIEARILARFPEAEVARTQGAGDAARLAREAVKRGYGASDLLVACGGDGTFREVAQAVGAAGGAVPLGMIPLGTVNQLSAQLGIPPGVEGALDVLAVGREVEIYPGVCRFDGGEEHFFFIGVSAGPEADAVHLVSPAVKRLIGRYAYVWSFLSRLASPVVPDILCVCGASRSEVSQVIFVKTSLYGGRFAFSRTLALSRPGVEAVATRGGRLALLGLSLRGLLKRPPAPLCRLAPGEGATVSFRSEGRFQIDGDAVRAARAEIFSSPRPIRVLAGTPFTTGS